MRNKGSILIISMMFMFVLMILVVAFLEEVQFNMRTNGRQYNEVQALYLAEAGINKAIYYLRNTAPNGNTTGTWSTSTNVYPINTNVNSSSAACSSTNPCMEPLYDESGTYDFGVYPDGSSYPVVGTYTVWVTNSQYSCGYGECIQIISQGKVGTVTKTIERYVTEDTNSSYNGLYATPIFDQWEECTTTSCPNITYGLEGWWRMDDYAASNTVLDSSGNTTNGTYYPNTSAYYTNNSGANTVSVAGVVTGSAPSGFNSTGTGALSFNGTSEYVNVPSPNTTPFSSGAITMSAWVKITSLPVSSNLAPILYFGTTGATYCGGGFMYLQSTGKVTMGFQNIGSSGNALDTSSLTLSTGTWYHLAWTYTNGGTIAVYINGVQDSSTTPAYNLDSNTQIYNLVMGSNIGTESSGAAACGGASYYFNGVIDDARVYNRALSAHEINMLYNFR